MDPTLSAWDQNAEDPPAPKTDNDLSSTTSSRVQSPVSVSTIESSSHGSTVTLRSNSPALTISESSFSDNATKNTDADSTPEPTRVLRQRRGCVIYDETSPSNRAGTPNAASKIASKLSLQSRGRSMTTSTVLDEGSVRNLALRRPSIQSPAPSTTSTKSSDATQTPPRSISVSSSTSLPSTSSSPSTRRLSTTPSGSSLVAASPSKTRNLVERTEVNLQDDIDAAADSILKGTGLHGADLYRCGFDDCQYSDADSANFKVHLTQHSTHKCYHCSQVFSTPVQLKAHIKEHGRHRYFCYYCDTTNSIKDNITKHFSDTHRGIRTEFYPLNEKKANPDKDIYVMYPGGFKPSKDFGIKLIKRRQEMLSTKKYYMPSEVAMLPPQNIYLDEVICKVCNFKSKVRTNMLRHLQIAECGKNKTVPQLDAVNPAPCLNTGEKHFDKMINLAASSNRPPSNGYNAGMIDANCLFVQENRRFVCGSNSCHHQSTTEEKLRDHIAAMHDTEKTYHCPHCNKSLCEPDQNISIDEIIYHLRLHDLKVFKCPKCSFCSTTKSMVDNHLFDSHPNCKNKVLMLVHNQIAAKETTTHSKSVHKFKCQNCKIYLSTRSLMQQHILEAHRLRNKYQCTLCSLQSDNKGMLTDHFGIKHPDKEIAIKSFYERVEVSVNSDVTPLWRRDDPNRVR